MGKNAVLLGAGADIGSNLLRDNDPARDGFAITDVITHAPRARVAGSLADIAARLTLAGPASRAIEVDEGRRAVRVDGREIRIHFGDAGDPAHADLGRFDLAVLATSRRDIRDPRMIEALRPLAPTLVCAAESPGLDAYFPVLDVPHAEPLLRKSRLLAAPGPDGHRALALGSCQCAGWAGQLRCVLEAVREPAAIRGSSVTILHPDTASSQFGTSGAGARREDPRDNLRLGYSQLAESLERFALDYARNDTSVRILTMPPGGQVSQFFVDGELTARDLIDACHSVAETESRAVGVAPEPIGSRAFAATSRLTTVVTDPEHVTCDRFDIGGRPMTRVVLRAWVHNTIGYAGTILDAGRRLLSDAEVRVSATLVEDEGEFHD